MGYDERFQDKSRQKRAEEEARKLEKQREQSEEATLLLAVQQTYSQYLIPEFQRFAASAMAHGYSAHVKYADQMYGGPVGRWSATVSVVVSIVSEGKTQTFFATLSYQRLGQFMVTTDADGLESDIRSYVELRNGRLVEILEALQDRLP